MAEFKELLQAQKETTDALRKVALAQGETFETAKESLEQQKNANRVAGGVKAAETRKANAEKASKGQVAKNARDDKNNADKERSIFKKMLGSLTDIKGSFGKLAGGAKKSIFAALKGLAIGGLILALAEFFDSPMFKKLTKKIGEIGQSFADVYTAFSEEGFLAGLKSIKDNLGNLLLGIGGLGLLFAPRLMFKGLFFLGKLAFKGGAWAIGAIFKGLFQTNLFGKGGVFKTLHTSIKGTFSSMKGSVLNAAKRGVLGAKNIVNSLRGSFGSFFGKGGALRTLASNIGTTAKGLLNRLTTSKFATRIADKFGSFFGKTGALRTFASNIGTTASNLTSRLARAVKTGLFGGKTSILSKFGSLFSPITNFGAKLATSATDMAARLAKSVSLGAKGAIGSIGSKFSNLFGSTKAFASRLGSASVNMAKRLLSSVSLSSVKGAAGTIASKFGNLFGSTRAFGAKLGTAAGDMAKRLASSISLSGTGIASKFTSLFTHTASFGTKVADVGAKMLTKLTSSTFATNIASKFTSLFTHTASFGTKVAGVAKSMLTSLGSSAALGIKGAAGTIVNGFGKLFTHSASFGSKLTGIGGKMLSSLTTSISTGAFSPAGIASKFTGLFTHTASFVTKLGTAGKGMLTSLTSSTFVTNIASKFTGLFAHTTSFASNLGTAAKSMAERLAKAVSTGAFSPSGIASKFKSMFGVLGTFGSKLGSLASSATSALGNVIKSTIAALPASIKNVVKGGMGTATKIGTKLVSGIGSMVAPVGSKTSLATRTAAALAKRNPVVKPPANTNKKPKIDPKKMAKLVERFPNLGKLTKYLGKVPVLGKLITGGLLINILMKGGKPADMAGDIGGLFGAVGGAALGGTLAGALGLAGGPLAVITGLAGAIGGGFAGDALGRALGQFIVGINPIDAFGWPFNWVDDLLNGGMAMMGAGGGSVSDIVATNVSAAETSALGSTPSGMAGMMGSSDGAPQTFTGKQLQARSLPSGYTGSGAFNKQMGVSTTVINSSGGNTTNHTSMNQMLGSPDQFLSSATR